MRIKDIYAGKPDAKDEITYCDNFEDFERSLIIPEQLDVSGLIDGDKCYITGYKGTGKTALLFYLDMSLRHIDQSACSSYIFFKEDFSDMKRTALEELSKRIISSISFNKDVLVDRNNFEYIWRWLLFKRICSDNDDNREEMRALYSSNEIGLIVNCFTGFKSVFSYAELLTRIKQYFGGTVLERDTNSIVKDLYRIGFLGNYSKRTKKFRWNYKGDQDVIIADEWFLFVHRALQPALSVENNFEDGLRQKKRLQSGQTVEATVIKRKKDRIIVNFEFDGKVIIGSYLADPNLLLAPGENRQYGPGENRQFQPNENRQCIF